MKNNIFKLNWNNFLNKKNLFNTIPYLFVFLLITLLTFFFIGFDISFKTLFLKTENTIINGILFKYSKNFKFIIENWKNLFILFFFFFIIFITLIVLIYKYKYFGLFIFTINLLFLAINNLLFFIQFDIKNQEWSYDFLLILLFSFFYFGIYLHVKFINFYKKFIKDEIKIFSFLKKFFINELFKWRYFFLIIFFASAPILKFSNNQIIKNKWIFCFFKILIFLTINSIFIQFFLFLIFISFLFYVFDSFVKKHIKKIKSFYITKRFKIKILNKKKFQISFLFIKISFLCFLILFSIIFLSLTMSLDFKSDNIFFYFKNFKNNFIENLNFISFVLIIPPTIYMLIRYRFSGFFVYFLLFPIKLVLFLNIFLANSLTFPFFLCFIFLIDFLLTDKFLNFYEKQKMIISFNESFLNKYIFLYNQNNETNKINNILLYLIFFCILLFFDLKYIELIEFSLIMFLIIPLMFDLKLLLFIFSIKIEKFVNSKFKERFKKIKFNSGKEEEFKNLND